MEGAAAGIPSQEERVGGAREKSFSLPYFRLEPIPGPVPPDLKLPEEVGEILLDLIRSEQDLILGWLDWLAAWVYILPENPYLSLPEILIFPW